LSLELITTYLKDPLESTSIVKVMHDCRQDSDALFHLAGIKLTSVFDVQLGHVTLLRKTYEEHPAYKPSKPFKDISLPIGFAKARVTALSLATHVSF